MIYESAGAIIWAPEPVLALIRRRKCPTCGVPRRMLGLRYEWLYFETACLTCGERWHDGERAERPFERGWRAKRVAEAKEWIRKNREMLGKEGKP